MEQGDELHAGTLSSDTYLISKEQLQFLTSRQSREPTHMRDEFIYRQLERKGAKRSSLEKELLYLCWKGAP
jgi:hypothetical protein